MGPGETYAATTFALGIICLLGWLYANVDNPRWAPILKKSLWCILLPILLTPAPFFIFPLGMWVAIAFEEGVKAFASTREIDPKNKFWLVSLFGVWELTLDKPFWGLVVAQYPESWNQTALIGLVLATTIPLVMHAVTAAIYAFWFRGRLWFAFITSCVVHTIYNESVVYFGPSLSVQLMQVAFLAMLLIALVLRRPPASYAATQ